MVAEDAAIYFGEDSGGMKAEKQSRRTLSADYTDFAESDSNLKSEVPDRALPIR
jgi:hypothetical protein